MYQKPTLRRTGLSLYLKQRISETYNRDYKHEGQLWDGRFHSVLVDRDDALARLYVTSYIELNSHRTKKKISPKAWRWCSYSTAIGDTPLAERARKGYELMFGVSWEEVVRRLESVFAAELPAGYDVETGDTSRLTSMAQLVKVSCRRLERGGFVSRDMGFAERTLAAFSPKFPAPGTRSVRFFGRLRWELAA